MSIKKAKGRLSTEDIKEQLEGSTVYELPITNELENSFMAYAMSVIVARALPDIRDGFKPVHRRILYAAYGLGMFADRPYKKSARLVGEVIGKYHPHGDSAVYQTMVRMAQDFSMRYLLIDGHGNFGSVDGDSPAAMRYTEARLSKISGDILSDLDKDTVDFVENYDGNELEPVVLPASFPNLLANGINGIAVGMATNMPPHNLVEICSAIKLVMVNKNPSTEDFLEVIKGPDFPTAGQILGQKGIIDYFNTGRGSVTVRSKSHLEELNNGKQAIVVTEIPYMVNKTALIEKIVDLVKTEDLKDITDLRDESSRDGIRIVIELKRDVIPEIILNKLYKSTQLQVNFSVNNLALVKGQPKILTLKKMIDYYLEHQHDVIIRKARYELQKAEERAHIVEGLIKVISDIDEAIRIIKNSEDVEAASVALMDYFKLSPVQAKAVLEMRLRALTNLEHQKLENELAQLRKQIEELKIIIESEARRNEIITEKLDYFIEKYGDERRTEILEGVSGVVDDESLIPQEDILITMSSNGWFKRVPVDTYKLQNRGGVGIVGAKTHEDDSVNKIIISNTHADLLFFTDKGKVYRIRGYEVPAGSRTSKGIPAHNFLNIEKNEKVLTVITTNQYDNGALLFITKKGTIKRTSLKEFNSIFAKGKIAITLNEGDELFNVHITGGNEEVYIGASNGNVVRFNENDVRVMGRTAAGVKGINLKDDEYVVGTGVSSEGDYVLSIGENGVGKLTDSSAYRLTKRGSKGVTTLKVSEKTGPLSSIQVINLNDEILLIANTGNIIRLKADQISIISRNTGGVKLMNLDKKEKVVSVAIFRSFLYGDDKENAQTHEEAHA